MADNETSTRRIAESVLAAVAMAVITWMWKRSAVGSVCIFFAAGCLYYLIRSARRSGNPRSFWVASIPYLLTGAVLAVVLIVLFP